jgi:hypothetical protein
MCFDPAQYLHTAPVAVAVVVCLYRDEFELYGTCVFAHTCDVQHERHSIVNSIEFLACA